LLSFILESGSIKTGVAAMAKKFSVVFNDHNADRIETVARRLKVQPDSLLLHFLLEKLTELEQPGGYTMRSKETSNNDYRFR
jgi:hypothetical protein